MRNSNKKGFTLVELVVVIAIIGVLAAILVPSMMGYVKKARMKTANGNAKTGYNAVAEWVAERETQGNPVVWSTVGKLGPLDCTTDKTTPTTEADQCQHLLFKALASNGNEAGEAIVAPQTINGEDTFFVHWRKASTDDIFGQYPQAIKDIDTCTSANWGVWQNV